jgi:hypothetical protein
MLLRCESFEPPMSQLGQKQTFAPSLGQVRFTPQKQTSIGAVKSKRAPLRRFKRAPPTKVEESSTGRSKIG